MKSKKIKQSFAISDFSESPHIKLKTFPLLLELTTWIIFELHVRGKNVAIIWTSPQTVPNSNSAIAQLIYLFDFLSCLLASKINPSSHIHKNTMLCINKLQIYIVGQVHIASDQVAE